MTTHEPFGVAAELLLRFTSDQPDGDVTSEQLTEWMQAVRAEHGHMKAMDAEGIATALHSQGFTTVHSIAGIDYEDLAHVQVPRAFAKVLVRYLGGRKASAATRCFSHRRQSRH